MPIDLTKLDSALQQKISELLQACRARGVEMRAYDGLRTPAEQAKLWRQSRPIEKIKQKIDQLHAAGAHYLAGVLSAVGPASGPHVTAAKRKSGFARGVSRSTGRLLRSVCG